MTEPTRPSPELLRRLSALKPIRIVPLPATPLPPPAAPRVPTTLTAFRITTREMNFHG